MKKFCIVVFLMCIITATSSLAICENTNIIFSDDFTRPDGAVGNGWNGDEHGDRATIENNMLKFNQEFEQGTYISHSLTLPTDYFQYSYKFKGNKVPGVGGPGSDEFYGALREGGYLVSHTNHEKTPGIAGDGFVGYQDSNWDLIPSIPFEIDTWYTIKAIVDVNAGTQDVYINDVLYGDNIRLSRTDWNYLLLQAANGKDPEVVWYVDDVIVEDCQENEELDYYTKLEVDEKISHLQEQIDSLNQQVSDLNTNIQKLIDYFTYLPQGLRQQLVCASMEKESINQKTDLGLFCAKSIVGQKDTCTCKAI